MEESRAICVKRLSIASMVRILLCILCTKLNFLPCMCLVFNMRLLIVAQVIHCSSGILNWWWFPWDDKILVWVMCSPLITSVLSFFSKLLVLSSSAFCFPLELGVLVLTWPQQILWLFMTQTGTPTMISRWVWMRPLTIGSLWGRREVKASEGVKEFVVTFLLETYKIRAVRLGRDGKWTSRGHVLTNVKTKHEGKCETCGSRWGVAGYCLCCSRLFWVSPSSRRSAVHIELDRTRKWWYTALWQGPQWRSVSLRWPRRKWC